MKHYYALFSGGLDSTLAILKTIAVNEPTLVTPVFFDYGQRAKEEEAIAVRRLVPELRRFARNPDTLIEDCRMYKINGSSEGIFSWSQSAILESRSPEGDVDIENRNMALISCVASLSLAERKASRTESSVEIITGFLNEHYDTCLSFVSAINRLFDAMGQQVKVIAPLIPGGQGRDRVSISKLISLAHSLDAYSLLRNNTWSCYFPRDGRECGKCSPCAKRSHFFEELGMKKVKRKPKKRVQ